jgi:hypothetical protein
VSATTLSDIQRLRQSEYGGGSIAVILIKTGTVNVDTIEKLEGWAAHYYGLTANLPSGHPYKTSPPYK